MSPQFTLHPDTWLSKLLNLKVSELRGDFASNLSEKALDLSFINAKSSHQFIFSFVPIGQERLLGNFISHGFQLIDMRVNFERARGTGSTQLAPNIRFAEAKDESEVRAIAERSFTYSRFHQDPGVPATDADRIKTEWAGNYFRGTRGDAMVVSEADGEITSFMLLLRRENTLIIDLIAVSHAYRGQGLTMQLINFAESQLTDFTTWSVGTQLSNTPSIRCYERAGFLFSKADYVLHFHS